MRTEWITHTGNKCPVPDDTLVEVQLRSGTKSGPWPALEFYWNQADELDDIVLYRLVNQTRAGATEMKAPQYLEAAAKHMADRAATYDQPDGERSMDAAVRALNAICGRDLKTSEGWLLLALLKASRLFSRDEFHRDSAEDLIAYVALMAEQKETE